MESGIGGRGPHPDDLPQGGRQHRQLRPRPTLGNAWGYRCDVDNSMMPIGVRRHDAVIERWTISDSYLGAIANPLSRRRCAPRSLLYPGKKRCHRYCRNADGCDGTWTSACDSSISHDGGSTGSWIGRQNSNWDQTCQGATNQPSRVG